MPTEAAKQHKPRPELATLHVGDPAATFDISETGDLCSWWIELSADATIVELAVLMHALRPAVRAVHVGEGVFRIYPLTGPASAKPPTAAELVRIMEAGFPGPAPTGIIARADA